MHFCFSTIFIYDHFVTKGELSLCFCQPYNLSSQPCTQGFFNVGQAASDRCSLITLTKRIPPFKTTEIFNDSLVDKRSTSGSAQLIKTNC